MQQNMQNKANYKVQIDNFAQFEIIGYVWRKIFLADIECCGRQTHKLFWDFPRGRLRAAFGVAGVGTEIPALEKKHILLFEK